MKSWVTFIIIVLIAYLVGVKYPSIGQQAFAKVGL